MYKIYMLEKDTKITNEVLNEVIEYNEKLKAHYDKLEKYHHGEHDIMNRQKDDRLSNNKIVVNHAKYITDINVGYLLGNPIEYQASSEYDIQPLLDEYKRQTINDLDCEIASDISIFGKTFEYIYANEEAMPRSCSLDNRNAIIAYDNTIEHNKLFGLIYREVLKGDTVDYYDIIFCDNKQIIEYQSSDKSLTMKGTAKPHLFGDVPMIEYKNNPDFKGDFECVMSLIDAYNLLISDRINDKEQLVDAILCMYGVDFTTEQAEMLKDSRMIADIPTDAKIEYLIKTLQEGDVEILNNSLVSDIHKISMTPNMSDVNFVGNSSGVAIKYKLLPFEQNVKNKERYMEKGLMQRFKLYNNFLVACSKMSEVPIEEVDAIFKRNLPQNDFETSQMINNLADFVDNETLIAQLSFIKDAKEITEDVGEEPRDDAYAANEIPDANNNADVIEPKDEEVTA